ncbi:MAG: xylulokinase [Anaerolineales bacterium]|nr:xylulokinase [Anaerolineales bacterium]
MKGRYLLGIDLGTSSVKVVLAEQDCRIIASAGAEYPILHPQPGFAEQDPEAWWQAAKAAVRTAVAQAGASDQIAAIGLSGQMHGTVLLDKHGHLLANAIIWPDQRSARQVQEITTLIGAERLYEIAGSPVSTGFQAASVRWVQQHQPDIWREVRMILPPKDYLRWRMTAVFATDPSDAAGALLCDEVERDWSGELLEQLRIDPSQLPPVQPSNLIAGHLTDEAASDLGLAAGIPVVTGAADTACSALGAGAVDSSKLLLTLSTGGQLLQPVERVHVDHRGRIHTFCSALEPAPQRAGWYHMGAILNAGMALRWLRDNLLGWQAPDAYDRMTARAEASPPGAQDLLFLPYLAGERTPHMDPTAKGVFFGLTLRHDQGDLIRAVMEGVVFAAYDAYQVLADLGTTPNSLILAGGGARSALWRRIVADVFNAPVQPLVGGEQSAIGALLLAGAGVGWFDLAQAARDQAQLGAPELPDVERHKMYRDRFVAFQALYARNQGHFS